MFYYITNFLYTVLENDYINNILYNNEKEIYVEFTKIIIGDDL